jgi:hypothetical protein
MRVHVTLTADNGTIYEGDIELAPAGAARTARQHARTVPARRPPASTSVKLDFTKSERAFVKVHARGLSGPKKFVLLLAHLAKGGIGKEVSLNEVQKRWNKMTAGTLLGCKFNTFYSNTAKDNGWVDTKEKGIYVLTSSWKEVLEP